LTNYSTLSVSNITLGGSVTQFTVYPGQTIAPVAPGRIGTLNITGDLQLRGTTAIDLRKSGAVLTSDKIEVRGSLDLGGALNGSLSGNTPLAPGDKFTLLKAASIANSFATMNLPSPGPGLAWTNKTAADGSIEVIASAEQERPVITVGSSPAGLTFSWPLSFTNFVLRGQTNPVTVGLSNNWRLVSGVVGNQITIAPDAANGTMFLQLIQQQTLSF
jgi:hypothetical protein